MINRHRAALLDGVNKKTSNHLVGDDLRSAILLPRLVNELMGVGKFLIIAPTEFLSFSLSSMSEQRDGLRFLADIRKIGVGTSLDAIWSGIDLGNYDIDMLAFNRPEVEVAWNDSTTDQNHRFPKQTLITKQLFPENTTYTMNDGRGGKITM